ncbi:hypothetical protein IF1G_03469 [Cordyceps javanica]|uniref:Uncharacterized protein n=1 Tax=Cordyceps javanica TaxID=43265 RepID=A0A545V7M7_9HYPO|nr:hypothetical protein IF1G_03469 [Cordyceps javanica]TQW09094.1 hypothetical protein IF2G_03525 [Cordyceps javanica]
MTAAAAASAASAATPHNYRTALNHAARQTDAGDVYDSWLLPSLFRCQCVHPATPISPDLQDSLASAHAAGQILQLNCRRILSTPFLLAGQSVGHAMFFGARRPSPAVARRRLQLPPFILENSAIRFRSTQLCDRSTQAPRTNSGQR